MKDTVRRFGLFGLLFAMFVLAACENDVDWKPTTPQPPGPNCNSGAATGKMAGDFCKANAVDTAQCDAEYCRSTCDEAANACNWGGGDRADCAQACQQALNIASISRPSAPTLATTTASTSVGSASGATFGEPSGGFEDNYCAWVEDYGVIDEETFCGLFTSNELSNDECEYPFVDASDYCS